MTRRRQILFAVAAVVVLAAAVVVVAVNNRTPAPTGGVASDKQVMIDAGSVSLAAEVITPRGVKKPPLVVMPASWGQVQTEYRAIARNLADDGYLVVSYAQRGFGKSTGQVDFAGAGTQADAKSVLDWALRTTDADPKRIGMYGISYGAGISLLAAAKDPRIKAVAALSTWTDLAASYDPNNTSNTRGLAITLGLGKDTAREDATVRGLRSLLKTDPRKIGPRMKQLSPSRSPITYVDALNRNKTAIMLANGFSDSLFAPQQLVTFYDKLTTPKRLQLAPGDHGGPEASALRGGGNSVANAASAWLGQYVRGDDSGIASEDPIALTDMDTAAVHPLRTWPANTKSNTLSLGEPNSKAQTGGGSKATWSTSIFAGADTVATSGTTPAIFGGATTPSAQLLKVAKTLAFAWTGPASTVPTTLAGTPRVRVNLASTGTAATVVAYLYDSDQEGTGRLISMQPYSMTGLRPRRAQPVTIDLQPLAWTVATGHRVVLVIDTEDPKYTGLNAKGTQISASATTASPATLSVPVVH